MTTPLFYQDGQVTMMSVVTGRTSTHTNPVPIVMVAQGGSITVEAGPYRVTGQAVFAAAGVPHTVHGQGHLRHAVWMDGYQSRLPAGAPPIFAPSSKALNAFSDFFAGRHADYTDTLAEAVCMQRLVLTPEIIEITHSIKHSSLHRLSQLEASRLVGMERTAMLKRFRRDTGMTFRGFKNWSGIKVAAALALNGSSIQIAADRGGFSDLSHFSRQCRIVFGMSPRQGISYVMKGAATRATPP